MSKPTDPPVMKMLQRRWLLWQLVVLALVACDYPATEYPEPDPLTHRVLQQGQLLGSAAANGAHVWMGVPYAASTAGGNRWRAPQPPVAWAETREFIVPGERCVQLTNAFDEDEGLEPGLIVGSEDCLTLDIYAPPDARPGQHPVFVWIHGGGNVWGRSSSYDGSRLAVNQDIVVVAVQYRLGPLGWFAHPYLRETAQDPLDGAASFATLDLVAALQWLQDNVGEFGGDPDKISIAGESHGAYNVATLLASPLASGLFQSAIMQSGGFDSMSIDEAQGDTGNRLNASKEIVTKLGVTSATQLRNLSVEQLLSAYTPATGFMDIPRVIEDGVVLPRRRLRQLFGSQATFNAVPLIIGSTLNEMKLFYISDERFIKNRLGVFPTVRDPEFWNLFTDYLSRLWRVRAVDEPAQLMQQAGHEAVYTYRFDWDDGGKFLLIDMKELFGASHGFDIPFVFNHFEHLGPADAVLFESATLDHRDKLSHAMGAYWAGLSRNGAPAASGYPAWPRYADSGGSFLKLDTDNDGGIALAQNHTDSLESLLADLNKDASLDAEQRCLIVEEMSRWMYAMDIEDRLKQETGCHHAKSVL